MTLRESLLAVSPTASFYIFLADAAIDDPETSDFTIAAENVALPDLEAMAFRYTLMEFATAIKPFCFLHLIEELKFEAAVYLDPDIQVFAPLADVDAAFQSGASCVLTPHLLEPLRDDKSPSNLDILKSGTFNLGFAGFTARLESIEFLKWWGEQLEFNCLDRVDRGLFVDQRYIDFAPSFLQELFVLRHPGYNVAYWNIINRTISKSNGQVYVDGQNLVFFHFSGVVPGDAMVFSKHQDRLEPADIGIAAEMIASYLEKLNEHGHAGWRTVPYSYGRFSDGTLIPPILRRDEYLPGNMSSSFEDPRWAEWNHPSEKVDQARGVRITRFMFAVHSSRNDLQAQFPLSSQTGRNRFHDWFLKYGRSECGAPDRAIAAALEGETPIQFFTRLTKKILRRIVKRAG